MNDPDSTWSHRRHTDGRRHVVVLSGELDLSSVPELDRLLSTAIDEAAAVDVDLGNVTFIDSTIIATLIAAHNTAASAARRMAVVNATGQVRRVLEMTGVLSTMSDGAANTDTGPQGH